MILTIWVFGPVSFGTQKPMVGRSRASFWDLWTSHSNLSNRNYDDLSSFPLTLNLLTGNWMEDPKLHFLIAGLSIQTFSILLVIELHHNCNNLGSADPTTTLLDGRSKASFSDLRTSPCSFKPHALGLQTVSP